MILIQALAATGALLLGDGCGLRSASHTHRAQRSVLCFVVATIAPSGEKIAKPAIAWNGAVDEDTVLVVLASSLGRPDSMHLSARSGPIVMLGDLPNATHADARGSWLRVPDSLLEPPRGSKYGNWTRSHRPERPYLTRLAINIWRAGKEFRVELKVAQAS